MSIYVSVFVNGAWRPLGRPLLPGEMGSFSDYRSENDRDVIHFECDPDDKGGMVARMKPQGEVLSSDREVRVVTVLPDDEHVLSLIPLGGRFELAARLRLWPGRAPEQSRVRFEHRADPRA